jgi:hypothetical protein
MASGRQVNMTILEGLRRAVSAKHAHSCLFADTDEPDHSTLPVVAARESARRRDTVCFPRLSRRERGAFLVDFSWLREELAR